MDLWTNDYLCVEGTWSVWCTDVARSLNFRLYERIILTIMWKALFGCIGFIFLFHGVRRLLSPTIRDKYSMFILPVIAAVMVVPVGHVHWILVITKGLSVINPTGAPLMGNLQVMPFYMAYVLSNHFLSEKYYPKHVSWVQLCDQYSFLMYMGVFIRQCFYILPGFMLLGEGYTLFKILSGGTKGTPPKFMSLAVFLLTRVLTYYIVANQFSTTDFAWFIWLLFAQQCTMFLVQCAEFWRPEWVYKQ